MWRGWSGAANLTPSIAPASAANELPQSRFGVSIKKALGGAVVRNRIRRRLREIVRHHRREIPAGWDIVIHPKSVAAKAPFAALTADLLQLLQSAAQAGK